jgi:AraC-like DNA-binding protein
MLQACLDPAATGMGDAQAQGDLTRLEQVRIAIRRHMHRATLNASMLCREVGMSRSQLYRLLEGEGGVVRYIQRLRLLAAHAALSDLADARSISMIAEATGFYDPSAFSRAFRREFGLTPTELRLASRAGEVSVPRVVMAAEAATLSGYLRGR